MFGLAGADRPLADGTTVTADENYLRQALVDPNGQVVADYPAAMPTFAGRLDDDQINALIAYIQSLTE